MTTREETQVKQIYLTIEQMNAAVKRATDNSKNWAVWKGPEKEKIDNE